MPAIEVERLRKTFKVPVHRESLRGAIMDLFLRRHKEIVAVKDISFRIPEGEICGYIGENGAGKSTTIKMLAGILVPTSGRVEVAGYVPWRDREAFVRRIGVVFGQRSQLWWDIGVIESFRLLRKVYRVEEADFRRRLDELTETLQLGELLHRPVRKLSLGQRMRCELAAALLHNPSILFLDEPTIGLDIVVKTQIREFLKKLNREHGTTILLTTHDLQDIEALCSRVIMLDEGQIIYDGSLQELKERWSRGREVRFRFSEPVEPSGLAALTNGLPVRWTAADEESARLWVPREIQVADVLARLVGALPIQDMSFKETGTDEIVRAIYQSGSASVPAAGTAADAPVPAAAAAGNASVSGKAAGDVSSPGEEAAKDASGPAAAAAGDARPVKAKGAPASAGAAAGDVPEDAAGQEEAGEETPGKKKRTEAQVRG